MTAVPTTDKNSVLRFIVARAKEASTYRGLMLIFTALGVIIRPEVSDAIVAFGIAAAGLAGVILPDQSE